MRTDAFAPNVMTSNQVISTPAQQKAQEMYKDVLAKHPNTYINAEGHLSIHGDEIHRTYESIGLAAESVPREVYTWEIPKGGLDTLRPFTGSDTCSVTDTVASVGLDGGGTPVDVVNSNDGTWSPYTLVDGRKYERFVAYSLYREGYNVFFDALAHTKGSKPCDQMDLCCLGLGVEVKSLNRDFTDDPDDFPYFYEVPGYFRVDSANVIELHERKRIAYIFVSTKTKKALSLRYEPEKWERKWCSAKRKYYYYAPLEKLRTYTSFLRFMRQRYNEQMSRADCKAVPKELSYLVYPSCPYDYSFTGEMVFEAPTPGDLAVSSQQYTAHLERVAEKEKKRKATLRLLDF